LLVVHSRQKHLVLQVHPGRLPLPLLLLLLQAGTELFVLASHVQVT
jgi:hypothetical protein